jgi:type IX secretion system PorP/SprF family membrane protein
MKSISYKLMQLLLAICFLNSSNAIAQDIHFSQFFEAPLYRNPALAGLMNADVRVQTVYRSQWNSVSNAYKTASLNGEYKMPVVNDDYMTLGMQLLYDRSGSIGLKTDEFLPALNYHKSLSEDRNAYLSVGFMGGMVQRSIDRSQMKTSNTYTNGTDGETNLVPNYHYFDGSAGISYNTQVGQNESNNLVLGVAYHHFNRPRNSFYGNYNVTVQPKWVFSADVKLAVNESAFVTIYNDHVRQGTSSEIMTGVLYGLKMGPYTDDPDHTLQAGVFLRWDDAVIPVIQMDYHPFTVSLSYDVNISRLSTSSYGRGGFELSLACAGFLNRESSTAQALRCPRF